jgi:hypothetical protein
MKNRIALTMLSIFLLLLNLPLYSQVTDTGSPSEETIGKDVAEQMIESVTIDKMEDAGFWYATMSQDQGLIRIMTRKGNPIEKEQKAG